MDPLTFFVTTFKELFVPLWLWNRCSRKPPQLSNSSSNSLKPPHSSTKAGSVPPKPSSCFLSIVSDSTSQATEKISSSSRIGNYSKIPQSEFVYSLLRPKRKWILKNQCPATVKTNYLGRLLKRTNNLKRRCQERVPAKKIPWKE